MKCPKCGGEASNPYSSHNWRFDVVYLCENEGCDVVEFAVSYVDDRGIGKPPTTIKVKVVAT